MYRFTLTHLVDPLLFIPMKDPVILKTSGMRVDRSTITSHLLSNPTDPFNRQPLSLADVEPDDALREKFNEWLKANKRMVESQQRNVRRIER